MRHTPRATDETPAATHCRIGLRLGCPQAIEREQKKREREAAKAAGGGKAAPAGAAAGDPALAALEAKLMPKVKA